MSENVTVFTVVTFANYCHKFWVKAKLGPKFAPDRSLLTSALSPRNLHSGKKPICQKAESGVNVSKQSFGQICISTILNGLFVVQAIWLKRKISSSSAGPVWANFYGSAGRNIFSWCFPDVLKHLVPPRADVLTKQCLDFICTTFLS